MMLRRGRTPLAVTQKDFLVIQIFQRGKFKYDHTAREQCPIKRPILSYYWQITQIWGKKYWYSLYTGIVVTIISSVQKT